MGKKGDRLGGLNYILVILLAKNWMKTKIEEMQLTFNRLIILLYVLFFICIKFGDACPISLILNLDYIFFVPFI